MPREVIFWTPGITFFGRAGQDPRAPGGPANLIPAGHADAVVSQSSQLLDLIQRWRSRGVKIHDGAITQRTHFLDLNEKWRCGPGISKVAGMSDVGSQASCARGPSSPQKEVPASFQATHLHYWVLLMLRVQQLRTRGKGLK